MDPPASIQSIDKLNVVYGDSEPKLQTTGLTSDVEYGEHLYPHPSRCCFWISDVIRRPFRTAKDCWEKGRLGNPYAKIRNQQPTGFWWVL